MMTVSEIPMAIPELSFCDHLLVRIPLVDHASFARHIRMDGSPLNSCYKVVIHHI